MSEIIEPQWGDGAYFQGTPVNRKAAEEGVVEEGPSTFDTAKSFFMRETVVGSWMNNGFRGVREGDLTFRDNDFNPYTYYQDNREEFEDLEHFMYQGNFEDVTNEELFKVRAENIRREAADLANIQNGSAGGLALGMAFSMLDLTTLIPLGKVSAATSFGKAALGLGAASGALMAGQELVLHDMQDTRTAAESFLNIGVGTALGGGIGVFARAVTPDAITHPHNPNNPLRVGNLEQGIETVYPGGTLAERDAGAAQVTHSSSEEAPSLSTPLSRLFDRVTPIGRSSQWRNARARDVFHNIVDIGGRIRKGNLQDEATPISAEDIAADWMTRSEDLMSMHHTALRRLNMELGKSDNRLKRAAANVAYAASGQTRHSGRIHAPDLNDIIEKRLFQEWGNADDQILAELLAARGLAPEDASKVLKTADDMVERIHMHNEAFEDEMVRLGMITEEQRMGRDYGMAQVWMPERIADNAEAFRDFFIQKWAKDPEDGWLLENYNLSPEEYARLPDEIAEGAEEGGAALSKKDIMNDWVGEDNDYRIAQWESRVTAAERRLADEEDTLKIIAHGLTVSGKEVKDLSTKSLKKAARKAEAELKMRGDMLSVAIREYGQSLGVAAKTVADVINSIKVGREAFPSDEAFKVAKAKAKKIKEDHTHIQSSQKRINKLKAQLDKAEAARAAAKAEYQAIKQGLKLQTDDVKEIKKALREAQRGLKHVKRKSNLIEQVDKLVAKLSNRERIPYGVDPDDVSGSARAKRRGIHLTANERRSLSDQGFLNRDVFSNIDATYHDLSARFALREKFGSEDLADVLQDLTDDYNAMIKDAPDAKTAQRLKNERESALRDIRGMRDRLLGRYQVPNDPAARAMSWGSKKLREWNFLRFGGGFLVSSLTDLATVALTAGFGGMTLRSYRHWNKVARQAIQEGNAHEMLALVRAGELALASSRSAKMNQIDDAILSHGIGTSGSALHKTTSMIDRVSGYLSEKMNLVNGMASWNTQLKGMAGLIQMQNIRRAMENIDGMDAATATKFATLGLDKARLKSIKKFMDEFGEVDEDGLFSPNTSQWTSPEGLEAARHLRVALKRTINRAVMTPGVGDTPLFMSNAAGKMILQFATYGFTAVNRFLTPATQRMVNHQDFEAMSAVTLSLGLGAMITGIKHAMRGDDPMDITPQQLVVESIDRGGLLAYLGPYLDAGIKVGGNTFNEAVGVEVFHPSSRYQQNKWWMSLMGPWLGAMGQGAEAGSAAVRGDWDQAASKAMNLAPYATFFRIMNVLATEGK